MFQFRPKGSAPSDPYYSPNRDLAYIGIQLTRKALQGFTDQGLSAEEKALMAAFAVGMEDLSAAGQALAAFHLAACMEREDPRVTWERVSSGIKPAALTIVHARVGATVMPVIFRGLREVRSEKPPLEMPTDAAVLLETARSLDRWMSLPRPVRALTVWVRGRWRALCSAFRRWDYDY